MTDSDSENARTRAIRFLERHYGLLAIPLFEIGYGIAVIANGNKVSPVNDTILQVVTQAIPRGYMWIIFALVSSVVMFVGRRGTAPVVAVLLAFMPIHQAISYTIECVDIWLPNTTSIGDPWPAFDNAMMWWSFIVAIINQTSVFRTWHE